MARAKKKQSFSKKSKHKHRKKGCMTFFLGSCALFVVGLIILLLVLMAMVFDPPETYKASAMTSEHVVYQSAIINRLLPVVMKSKPGDTSRLILSPEEVNSILRFIENSGDLADFLAGKSKKSPQPSGNPFKVEYLNGKFIVKFAADTGFRNPFGSYIVIKMKGRPVISEKDVLIDVDTAKIGDVPIPEKTAEIILKAIIDDYSKDDIFRQIRDTVKKAYVDPNQDLVIIYYPYKLRNYVIKNFLWNFG
jgi:hypothetical protein